MSKLETQFNSSQQKNELKMDDKGDYYTKIKCAKCGQIKTVYGSRQEELSSLKNYERVECQHKISEKFGKSEKKKNLAA